MFNILTFTLNIYGIEFDKTQDQKVTNKILKFDKNVAATLKCLKA